LALNRKSIYSRIWYRNIIMKAIELVELSTKIYAMVFFVAMLAVLIPLGSSISNINAKPCESCTGEAYGPGGGGPAKNICSWWWCGSGTFTQDDGEKLGQIEIP
jgi:hypothetical protein